MQQGIYLQGFAHCTAVREEVGLAGVEAGDNTVETVATTGKLVINHSFLLSKCWKALEPVFVLPNLHFSTVRLANKTKLAGPGTKYVEIHRLVSPLNGSSHLNALVEA